MALAKTYILKIFTKQNVSSVKMWDDDESRDVFFAKFFGLIWYLKGATGDKTWPEF